MLIGTHHGRFHADEVMAVAILKQLYPDAIVVRSRATDVLATCDLVVDVGGGFYDHHTTNKVFRENGSAYASAGLIWRDFGRKAITMLGYQDGIETIFSHVDAKLIEGIDLVDNGVHLEKDARVRGISETIGLFNPTWDTRGGEEAAFAQAVSFASQVLLQTVAHESSRVEAARRVTAAYEATHDTRVLILNEFCPWTETLLAIDKEEKIIFVVFPDKTGDYRLQVVPRTASTFEPRKPLPASWAGLEHDALAAVVGVPDAVFCHPARFIAGAKSKFSILQMATLALQDE